eukprot:CAMPEP_0116880980 /NCGR_PEP_ID=MMETSP0463-20121206/13025_1 /TAXON_ID=181622 /ORGANISM="Strombidinopsis sp, Strain SopsisLIS2011" /LENGTH=31 /DNA_ID= /DNA_START= /DNA_END= /DNA_ORIENTATION=
MYVKGKMFKDKATGMVDGFGVYDCMEVFDGG